MICPSVTRYCHDDDELPGRRYRRGRSHLGVMRRFPNEKVGHGWFAYVRSPDGARCPRYGTDDVRPGARHKQIPFEGSAELDDSHFRGRNANRAISERRLESRRFVGRVPVGGTRDRPTNEVTATVLTDAGVRTIQRSVRAGVQLGATFVTDEAMAYQGMPEYVSEFAGRHNQRDADTTDQVETMASSFLRRRLRYADRTS